MPLADYEKVTSREDFVAFLYNFKSDPIKKEDYWQNVTLDAYLGNMAFWVEKRIDDFLQRRY